MTIGNHLRVLLFEFVVPLGLVLFFKCMLMQDEIDLDQVCQPIQNLIESSNTILTISFFNKILIMFIFINFFHSANSKPRHIATKEQCQSSGGFWKLSP